MSKKLIDPSNVPQYPQVVMTPTPPDFASDESLPINRYIMRSRMVTQSGNAGQWGVIQVPSYHNDTTSVNSWTTNNPLHNQIASLDRGQTSTFGGITYVSTVNITLEENVYVQAATSGVKVWFRWMPLDMFASTPTADPAQYVQKDGDAYAHEEWSLIGFYNASSFTVTLPRPSSYATNKYFQILVTANTTTKPTKYNYRWVWTDGGYTGTRIGETNGSNRGYLPWNPYYGAALNASSPWATFHRQRTTMQDLAIFYPRKWHV